MFVNVSLVNGRVVPGMLLMAVAPLASWDMSLLRGFVAIGTCIFECALWDDSNVWYVQFYR